jgi:Mg2+ transporter MgtE
MLMETPPEPSDSAAEEREAVAPLVESLTEPEHEALSEEERERIGELDDAELGQLIESVPSDMRAQILDAMPLDRYWPVLRRLQHETLRNVFKLIPAAIQDALAERAEDSDLIELAEELPRSLVENILVEVEPDRAEQLQAALAYDEEELGRYMKTDVMRVRGSGTIRRLRMRLGKRKTFPAAIVVLDDERQAAGVLTYRELARAGEDTRIRDIVSPVTAFRDTTTLAEAVQEADFSINTAWYPVSREGAVVGAIAACDLLDKLRERDREHLGMDTPGDEEDLFTPVLRAARVRAIWLVINLGTAFLASAVIALFEDTLERVVALAVLMPVVASMGGIAGSQTLAIAIRGLALKHLSEANLRPLLLKEARVAVLTGLGLGFLVGLVVWQWFDSARLGAIIAVAILVNGLAAAYAGTMVPFLLKKLRIDPAVSGSVILTTVTDVVGFFLFLGLGTLVFVTLA